MAFQYSKDIEKILRGLRCTCVSIWVLGKTNRQMEILCNTVRCQDPEFRAVYMYSISETIIIIINKILRNHKK